MEIWKDIKGYEGLYQISNQGRVKSLPKKVGGSHRKECILKQHLQHSDYHMVGLYGKENKTKQVHRLVAEAFIPNPDDKPEVNHKDGDKSNNNDWNLEWNTSSENKLHAFANGLRNTTGVKHPSVKLTEAQVLEIRTLKGKQTEISIAKQYGVSRGCINGILLGINWTHI